MSWFSSTPAPVEVAFVPVSNKPVNGTTVNLEQSEVGIPAETVPQLAAKLEEFKNSLTSAPEEWEAFMETLGVKGIRKFVEGREIGVIRSEVYMPFHIVDIFDFLVTPSNGAITDPMINTVEYFKKFSPHSWNGCVMIHGQWPVISPREFVNFFHWRLLEDGSVLFFGFSVDDASKPITEEAVRGWDHMKGYMLRPTDDGTGTDVHMIFDSDPRGDLPTMLINQAMLNQPTGLAIARDALQKLSDEGKLRDVNLPARYEDFLAVVAKRV